MDQDHASIYRKLGVEPIVNCGSSRSVYGNSTMSDPVHTRYGKCVFQPCHHVGVKKAAGATGGVDGCGNGDWLPRVPRRVGPRHRGRAAANDPLRMLQLPEQFSTKRRAR